MENILTCDEWLEQYGVSKYDVMTDDDGREFIQQTDENGTSGEDGYDVREMRIYLPEFKEANDLWKI